MRYQGGKARIAKTLAGVILEHTDSRTHYYEPFLGGGSMAAALGNNFEHAHYSDAHGALILMWQAAHAGHVMYGDARHFFPADITVEDYDYHKKHRPHAPATALLGFGSAYGGRYYCSGYNGAIPGYSDGTTFHQVALKGLAKKMPGMIAKRTTEFTHNSYREITPPAGAVIYCDPPYAGTRGYIGVEPFDHETFWDWCRTQATRGCKVFISEAQAPADFEQIFEKQKHVTMLKANTQYRTEKLYTL